MKDIQKSMKFSMIFGFIGAVAVPVFYEIYANVSNTIGLVMVCCFALVAGVAFSTIALKSALLGITVSLAYTGIFGMLVYVLLHPIVVNALKASSVYFQLSLKEQAMFLLYTALILFGMYIVCLICKGVTIAINQVKNNREKSASYIADAFSDSEDER